MKFLLCLALFVVAAQAQFVTHSIAPVVSHSVISHGVVDPVYHHVHHVHHHVRNYVTPLVNQGIVHSTIPVGGHVPLGASARLSRFNSYPAHVFINRLRK